MIRPVAWGYLEDEHGAMWDGPAAALTLSEGPQRVHVDKVPKDATDPPPFLGFTAGGDRS